MERKLIAVAVASAMGLPMAADAVDIDVSGHVNRALTIENQDGNPNDGDIQLKTGNGSETRFRMKGSEELDNGLTIGVNFEVGAGGDINNYKHRDAFPASEDPDEPGNTKAVTGSDFRVRHANVSLSSAGGTVTFGQTGRASDSAPYADVGSTWIAGATNWCSYGGGGPACNALDRGRTELIKYDSPALGPASISASFGESDFWDVAANISGSAGDAGYNLRVGYIGKEEVEAIMASASVTVGSTGVAAAWSNGDGEDKESQYVKLDHSYGDGSVAVYYKQGRTGDDEGSLWGVGVAHSLGGGATAYAGYRIVDNDNAEELGLVIAGMRVTFN